MSILESAFKVLVSVLIMSAVIRALGPVLVEGIATLKERRARRDLKRALEREFFPHRFTPGGRERWRGTATRRREAHAIDDLLDKEFLRDVADIYGNEEV